MPQFILDTSGENRVQDGASIHGRRITWADLDAFTQAYITALFFTETSSGQTKAEWNFATAEDSLPSDASFADIAPDTLASIIADCAKFQADMESHIVNAGAEGEFNEAAKVHPDNALEQAGHDFWLTRNGHGAGFWDGDWPEPQATKLDEAAKAFGELSVYFGDDGKVYAQ